MENCLFCKIIGGAIPSTKVYEDEKIFAYTRDTETEHLLVVCNFTGETLNYEIPQRFNGSELLIGNYATEEPGLRPYEAAMLYYKN